MNPSSSSSSTSNSAKTPKATAIAQLTGTAPLAMDWNKENVPVTPKLKTPGTSGIKRPLFSSSGMDNIQDSGSGFKIKRRKGLSERSSLTLEDVEDLGQSPMIFVGNKKVAIEASPNLVGPTASLNISETPKRKTSQGQMGEATTSSPPTPVSSFRAPNPRPPIPTLQRSYSENVMRSCFNADNHQDLTGAFNQSLTLPLLKAGLKHQDLHTIDCHTMADLLRGKYDDKVEQFRIVDARYCYEFAGGHIRGAENFGKWDEKMFFDEFMPDSWPSLPPVHHSIFRIGDPVSDEQKALENRRRKIIIFHCEFSSARGPALMKELRKR